MRTITLTSTGTAVSAAAPMDIHQSPFNVGMGLVISGTVNVKVQHTFGDILNTAAASLTWFDHPTMTALTASADGNYAFPVTAIRLNQASGSGTATLTIAQAGMPGK